MSQRIQIVLPDPATLQLRELATAADTPPSTLAAQLVHNGLAQAAKDGKVRALRSAPVLVGSKGSERAPWLEPYGGSNQWRKEMWGAIVALHGRYPKQLETLKDKWWKDESQTETLCALATWRAELDDTGQDPREELAFQTNSQTTPTHYANKEAASPKHGNPAHHQTNGPHKHLNSTNTKQANVAMRPNAQWLTHLLLAHIALQLVVMQGDDFGQ